MNEILLLILFIIASIAIAFLIGKNKRIGFAWTLFFGLFLTPISALIFSLLSYPKEQMTNSKGDKYNIPLGVIMLLLSLGAMRQVYTIDSLTGSFDTNTFIFGMGLLGLAIYFFMRTNRNKKINEENGDKMLEGFAEQETT